MPLEISCSTRKIRRLIGSPKLQIIFHKRATTYRSLLREMTYKDKGSSESSPPCTNRNFLLDKQDTTGVLCCHVLMTLRAALAAAHNCNSSSATLCFFI
mmetsp:Transcript_2395/g.3367  ORF Transcript_2395/g.3367 Transcript_2395/m.3367 type:complete len:99 (-) Transcript_2395:4157-4453(-)